VQCLPARALHRIDWFFITFVWKVMKNKIQKILPALPAPPAPFNLKTI
jgi:hypothetical protein